MEPQWYIRCIDSVKKVIMLSFFLRYDNIVAKHYRIFRDLFIWIFILQIRVYLKWRRYALHAIHTSVRNRLCSTQETVFFSVLPVFLSS